MDPLVVVGIGLGCFLVGYLVFARRGRITLQLTARAYGRLCIAADLLSLGPSRAVESLVDRFLDERWPGAKGAAESKALTRREEKEMELTGYPMIDRLIYSNRDKIGAWVASTLTSAGSSEKKKEFAQALGSYLDLFPKENP